MNDEISNLLTLSKNKYNINLLETIEHKELFQNLNTKINKNEFNKNQYKTEKKKQNDYNINNDDKDYFIINEEDSSKKEKMIDNKDSYNNNDNDLYFENEDSNCNQENSIQKIINKAKNSSKSFKNIVKKKLNNFQGLFNNLSPEKKEHCITQEDYINNENNNKSKKNNNNINKNKIKNNNNIIKNENIKRKEIDIKDFSFERNNKNNNLYKEQNNYYYTNQNKNDNENKNYFKSSKKNESNISYYNHNDNNNNLDVYNRLYNKSYYTRKKNNINVNEENNCTFNPQLLSNFKNKKNMDCLDNFIKRQEQFNKYIKQKKINLKKDINKMESKKYTFTPNTSCTSGSKYSIKLEAQRLEESNLDKANRLVYDSVKKIKEKNDNLSLMYNTQYSFIPTINKYKKINYKRNKSNDNYYMKKNINQKRETSAKKEKKNIKKYVNHQYDNIRSNYKNDKELMNRIKEENKKRTKRIDNMRKDQENEDFECCTFKPDIQKNKNYYINKLNNIKYNYYDNKESNREMSYVDYYNKKKYYTNKINRSQSYNRNNNSNLYINSNINYNNYSNSICNYNNQDNCYNITDCEYDNYNDYNDYSNYSNNNNYSNNYYYNNNKCIDFNNDEYNFNFSDNNDNFEEYEKGRRSFSHSYYTNKKDNYLYMTPKPNKMYFNENKFRPINEIKNEDKQNFLLIHKLLYE